MPLVLPFSSRLALEKPVNLFQYLTVGYKF
jgi:hypothetical protein